MYVVAHKIENEGETIYSSGKADAKGRIEGVRVETCEVTMVNRPENCRLTFYTLEEGLYYAARITKTKNGKDFGASQPRQFFKTEADRHQAIVKRLVKAGV